jgi:hypothetical protein
LRPCLRLRANRRAPQAETCARCHSSQTLGERTGSTTASAACAGIAMNTDPCGSCKIQKSVIAPAGVVSSPHQPRCRSGVPPAMFVALFLGRDSPFVRLNYRVGHVPCLNQGEQATPAGVDEPDATGDRVWRGCSALTQRCRWLRPCSTTTGVFR